MSHGKTIYLHQKNTTCTPPSSEPGQCFLSSLSWHLPPQPPTSASDLMSYSLSLFSAGWENPSLVLSFFSLILFLHIPSLFFALLFILIFSCLKSAIFVSLFPRCPFSPFYPSSPMGPLFSPLKDSFQLSSSQSLERHFPLLIYFTATSRASSCM